MSVSRTIPKISEAQAVDSAERFVTNNGYTDVVPADTEQISMERIDASDRSRRLAERFNTLKRRACGIIGRDVSSGGDGWTVVFCFNKDAFKNRPIYPKVAPMLESHGRPVVMGPDGSGIRVLHEDVLLDQSEMKRLK